MPHRTLYPILAVILSLALIALAAAALAGCGAAAPTAESDVLSVSDAAADAWPAIESDGAVPCPSADPGVWGSLRDGRCTYYCRAEGDAGVMAFCAGRCVDLRTDPNHCGGCGNACRSRRCGAYSCQ